MKNGLMILITLVFVSKIVQADSADKNHIYLKNDTSYILSVNNDIHIRPFHIGILSTHNRPLDPQAFSQQKRSLIPHMVNVEAVIKTMDPRIPPCQIQFKTYAVFRFNQMTLSTFVLVSERNQKLICQPIVFETRGHHTIRSGGAFYSLNEANSLQSQSLLE